MSDGGTNDVAEFTHEINCGVESAWNALFTKEFDEYYLSENNIGRCDEIDVSLSEDGSYYDREIRIFPNLGNGSWIDKFVWMIQYLYEVDHIKYTSVQKKYVNPENGTYTMTFENKDYVPKIESFNSNGLVTLTGDDKHCTLKTVVYVKTYISMWMGHYTFMKVLRSTTDDVFTKMCTSLEKYCDEKSENNNNNNE